MDLAPVVRPSEPSWLEKMQHDPTLADFVDAEVCRAGIELDAVKSKLEHRERACRQLQRRLDAAVARLEQHKISVKGLR